MVMYKIERKVGGGAWGGSKNRMLGQTQKLEQNSRQN